MRFLAAISSLLVLGTLSACGALSPTSQAPNEQATDPAPQETVDILAATKSSGQIVYEGGSVGVEVPRLLEHYYTPSGAVALKGTLSEPVPNGKTGGASFAIGPEAEQVFSGKTINIKIVSSAAQAGEAFLVYSTNEVGNSGWVAFPVTTEESVATVSYLVPPMAQGLGDFIGIDPNGNEITIKAIVVDIEG